MLANRGRRYDASPCCFEFANRCRVERMDRGNDRTCERRVKLTPLARWNDRPCSQGERLKQLPYAHRVGREHFAEQRNRRQVFLVLGRLHRTGFGLFACVLEHRAGQDIFGFGVRRHAESGHINANDANAVDGLRQHFERYARGRRNAEIRNDDRVVLLGVSHLMHAVANVFVQLACNERFRIERDVADRTPGTVEVARKGQPVYAARGP